MGRFILLAFSLQCVYARRLGRALEDDVACHASCGGQRPKDCAQLQEWTSAGGCAQDCSDAVVRDLERRYECPTGEDLEPQDEPSDENLPLETQGSVGQPELGMCSKYECSIGWWERDCGLDAVPTCKRANAKGGWKNREYCCESSTWEDVYDASSDTVWYPYQTTDLALPLCTNKVCVTKNVEFESCGDGREPRCAINDIAFCCERPVLAASPDEPIVQDSHLELGGEIDPGVVSFRECHYPAEWIFSNGWWDGCIECKSAADYQSMLRGPSNLRYDCDCPPFDHRAPGVCVLPPDDATFFHYDEYEYVDVAETPKDLASCNDIEGIWDEAVSLCRPAPPKLTFLGRGDTKVKPLPYFLPEEEVYLLPLQARIRCGGCEWIVWTGGRLKDGETSDFAAPPTREEMKGFDVASSAFERARDGEEILMARDGRFAYKLRSYSRHPSKRGWVASEVVEVAFELKYPNYDDAALIDSLRPPKDSGMSYTRKKIKIRNLLSGAFNFERFERALRDIFEKEFPQALDDCLVDVELLEYRDGCFGVTVLKLEDDGAVEFEVQHPVSESTDVFDVIDDPFLNYPLGQYLYDYGLINATDRCEASQMVDASDAATKIDAATTPPVPLSTKLAAGAIAAIVICSLALCIGVMMWSSHRVKQIRKRQKVLDEDVANLHAQEKELAAQLADLERREGELTAKLAEMESQEKALELERRRLDDEQVSAKLEAEEAEAEMAEFEREELSKLDKVQHEAIVAEEELVLSEIDEELEAELNKLNQNLEAKGIVLTPAHRHQQEELKARLSERRLRRGSSARKRRKKQQLESKRAARSLMDDVVEPKLGMLKTLASKLDSEEQRLEFARALEVVTASLETSLPSAISTAISPLEPELAPTAAVDATRKSPRLSAEPLAVEAMEEQVSFERALVELEERIVAREDEEEAKAAGKRRAALEALLPGADADAKAKREAKIQNTQLAKTRCAAILSRLDKVDNEFAQLRKEQERTMAILNENVRSKKEEQRAKLERRREEIKAARARKQRPSSV